MTVSGLHALGALCGKELAFPQSMNGAVPAKRGLGEWSDVTMGRADGVAMRLEPANSGHTSWHYEDVTAAILRTFDPRREASESYSVLEAGGGSSSHLPLPAGAKITTIDISPEQLAANDYATERLLGDLQTFDYGTRRYNLIIAWDVLEHLSEPEAALARFADILEPGGRLLVVGPQRYTLKGLITRASPHPLHVAFYRYVLGSPDAGKPGHPPFPAYLAPAAEPNRIAAFIEARGLEIDRFVGYESSHVGALAERGALLIGLYRAAEWLLSIATAGRYRRGMTDFFMIARKPPTKKA